MSTFSEWSAFSYISADAFYDFLSQTICMSKYDRMKFNIENDDHKKLLIHELSHLHDHVYTLWGIENICKIYNALNSIINQKEKDFFHISSLYNDFKKNQSTKFYQFEGADILNYKSKWNIGFTVGLRYDNNGRPNKNSPIILIRFNKEDGNLLIRVPLSMESILESRAIFQELLVDVNKINDLDDVSEKIIEESIFRKQTLNLLYNAKLATYSSATHLLAHNFEICDILDAYSKMYLLSSIALNLPHEFFKNIYIDEETKMFFRGREKAFLKNHDRAFLYYTLVKNSSKLENLTIENILSTSNLPNINIIENSIKLNIKTLKTKLISGSLKLLALIRCDDALKICNKTKWINQINLSSSKLDLDKLPIIFGDDSNGDLCDLYERIHNLDTHLKEFLDACGY